MPRFSVLRLLPDGRVDTSFGGQNLDPPGLVETDFGLRSEVRTVAIQPDGKIVAFGRDGGDKHVSYFAIARYLENGQLDPTFGDNGHPRTHVTENRGGALGGVVLPSGQLIAAGYKYPRNDTKPAVGLLIAYGPDGDLESRFGKRGFLSIKASDRQSLMITDAELLPSGKLMLGGQVGGRFMLMRIFTNGQIDRSFGNQGGVLTDVDGVKSCPCAYTSAMTLGPGGKILMTGRVTGPKSSPAVLVRYLANGRLDRGFGRKGIVRVTRGRGLEFEDVGVAPSGAITAAGAWRNPRSGEIEAAVARFQPNGALDSTFGASGLFSRDFGLVSVASAVLVQPDGKVVVGGRANPAPSEFPEIPNPLIGAEYLVMRFLP